VETVTVGGTIEIGDLFILTMNGKSLSVAATTTVAATTAAEIVAAWNALSSSTHPEFAEITAAVTAGGSFTLTHDTPGVPFTVVASTTESNGAGADAQTFGQTTTIAASGPNHWSAAANWSLGAVPVNTNDVDIEDSDVDILYGLAQSAVTLASLNIAKSYTGQIGLPFNNVGGYAEYRDQYLNIKATIVNIGQIGSGAGSDLIKLNTDSAQTELNVFDSGSPQDSLSAIQWKGTHASNVVNLMKGSFAAAQQAGETATIATLRVGYQSNPAGDVEAYIGAGVTLGVLDMAGGEVIANCAITTATMVDGLLICLAGNITTLNLDGGTADYRGAGTITTANIGSGGVLDLSHDTRARTISNCNLHAAGEIKDPFKKGSYTNGIALVRCSLDEVKLDVGTHRTLTGLT
jgi:hypothetical protein